MLGALTAPHPWHSRAGWWSRPQHHKQTSLNHFISASKQSWRDRDPTRPRDLEVDDQLDFGRLVDRQISRLFALEYPATVNADLPEHIAGVGPVGGETASQSEVAIYEDRGYL